MEDNYNNEKYRVCLDEYQDEDGECYAYAIELATTDGNYGFGVDTIQFNKSKGQDLEDVSHIEIIELKYFDDLEEAKKCYNKLSEDYCIPE